MNGGRKIERTPLRLVIEGFPTPGLSRRAAVPENSAGASRMTIQTQEVQMKIRFTRSTTPGRPSLRAMVAFAGCALALAAGARADGAPLDPRVLGVNESLLKYCEPLDEPGAMQLRQKIKLMVKGRSDLDLANLRASDAYRQGYEAETKFVSMVEERNAHRACADAVAKPKPKAQPK